MKSFKSPVVSLAAVLVLAVASSAVSAFPGHGKKHRMEHYFNKVDANGDGFISQQEQLDFTSQRFLSMDANGDGMLSKEEIKQAHGKRHKERRHADEEVES